MLSILRHRKVPPQPCRLSPNCTELVLFAAYLTQLTDTGAYGKALLPIVHMAVFGKHRIPLRHYSRTAYETEREAEGILTFIISIAAPSLRSLTVLGFDAHYKAVGRGIVRIMINPSTCFPNLQRLVLLHQHVVTLFPRTGQNEDYLSHCYPQLTSLYTHNGTVSNDVLALRTLRELRVDMLHAKDFDLPSPPILHLETITIDSRPYSGLDQTRSVHHEEIDEFINAKPSSLKCTVVVAQGDCVHSDFVLYAWEDIVQGGSRCRTEGEEPTTHRSRKSAGARK